MYLNCIPEWVPFEDTCHRYKRNVRRFYSEIMPYQPERYDIYWYFESLNKYLIILLILFASNFNSFLDILVLNSNINAMYVLCGEPSSFKAPSPKLPGYDSTDGEPSAKWTCNCIIYFSQFISIPIQNQFSIKILLNNNTNFIAV